MALICGMRRGRNRKLAEVLRSLAWWHGCKRYFRCMFHHRLVLLLAWGLLAVLMTPGCKQQQVATAATPAPAAAVSPAPAVVASQAPVRAHFYAYGSIRGTAGDSLVRFDTAPSDPAAKKDIHAVLCCEDSFTVRGNDTLYAWRTERTAVYRGNYLGGAGFTLLWHKRIPAAEATEPKAQLAARILKPGSYALAAQSNDAYQADGWEVRYKDRKGILYSTAWGPQPNTQFVLTSASHTPGNAVGGFGNYEYLLEGELQSAALYTADGKLLPLRDFRIRVGMWAEETRARK